MNLLLKQILFEITQAISLLFYICNVILRKPVLALTPEYLNTEKMQNIFFIVQLFELVVRFDDVGGIVDHLCLNVFL